MGPVHGSHKALEEEEEDVISRMPEDVITNILERLPIQDAVRTGILSTNWRFNWTMLSRLVFNHTFFKPGSEGKSDLNESNIISRILFQLKGSITRFHLGIPDYTTLNVDEVSLWVMFLSRKGIKEFTLLNHHDTPLKLPTHLFSCLELKILTLYNCSFHPPPSFHGFPNLLSLHLISVRFESYKCEELITRCPLLNTLSIAECVRLSSKVKLAEIAKLKNLLFLYISLSTLDITTPVTTFNIFQLVGFFPKLEMLYLDFKKCKFLAESGSIKGVTTSFPCLETLKLYSVDFGNDDLVSYVFEMICCSPNLQTLDLDLSNDDVPPPAICSSALDDKTMGKLQLRSVVFSGFRGSENEVHLIKSLLACSPLLTMMRIGLNSSSMIGGADGKFMFASKLLKLYRASPLVEIDLL